MRGVGRSWEGKTGCGKMLYTGSDLVHKTAASLHSTIQCLSLHASVYVYVTTSNVRVYVSDLKGRVEQSDDSHFPSLHGRD